MLSREQETILRGEQATPPTANLDALYPPDGRSFKVIVIVAGVASLLAVRGLRVLEQHQLSFFDERAALAWPPLANEPERS